MYIILVTLTLWHKAVHPYLVCQLHQHQSLHYQPHCYTGNPFYNWIYVFIVLLLKHVMHMVYMQSVNYFMAEIGPVHCKHCVSTSVLDFMGNYKNGD